MNTLLGYLATQLASHPENLATEALGYILRGSSMAREGLCELLAHSGMHFPSDLTYLNQVGGDDQPQPDIEGRDGDGQTRLVIEAKFWAGLTAHQPITYLGRVPAGGGVLLFVAPAAREAFLWGELIRRCKEAGLDGTQSDLASQVVRIYTLRDGRKMALISWRSLLNYIRVRLEAVGDRGPLGDLVQLAGLCEHMDTTAFVPLTSEDLTTGLYKRVLQFSDIVDDIVRILVDQGVGDTKGLTAVSTKGVYGRYLRFRGVGCHLGCDVRRWTSLAPTPLWLTVGQQFMGGCSFTRARGVGTTIDLYAETTLHRGEGTPDYSLVRTRASDSR
jgi:hypothetical protein